MAKITRISNADAEVCGQDPVALPRRDNRLPYIFHALRGGNGAVAREDHFQSEGRQLEGVQQAGEALQVWR